MQLPSVFVLQRYRVLAEFDAAVTHMGKVG